MSIVNTSIIAVLLDLNCTDADSGPNGNITMQVMDGDDPASNKFQLSGTQLSALGGDLDYETLESSQYMYILTVAAEDAPQNESPKTGVTLVIVSVSKSRICQRTSSPDQLVMQGAEGVAYTVDHTLNIC